MGFTSRPLFSFQFPSNGKVFPNKILWDSEVLWHWLFQFPSNGKVFPNKTLDTHMRLCDCCFNSLQTGRSFRTLKIKLSDNKTETLFQFPSNGKVFPNRWRCDRGVCLSRSFNSLQTGRSFRTFKHPSADGKGRINVSIPFKREGLSEQTSRSAQAGKNN